MIEKLLYLIFEILGFISVFISSIWINKKYKIISLEHFIYSYFFFFLGFVICAKLFHIILDLDFNYLFSNDFIDKIKFVLSGYTFIGGYIGGVIAIILFSKLIKDDKYNILKLYLPSLLLMYSVMKIGCYVNGCCYGINEFPIQLAESFLNILGYIFILIMIKKNSKNVVSYSLIIFGLSRFLVSFFRVYDTMLGFIFIQLFCLAIIYIGIKLILKNKKHV